MWKYHQMRLTFVFVIVFCTILIAFAAQDDDLYVIRSKHAPGGLVLDGSNSSKLTVEFYNGFDTQLWKLKSGAKPGQFYIINSYTNEAVDFNGDRDPLVTKKQTDSLHQQFTMDSAGHIINVANKKNIDISHANFQAGNHLILWENNGCSCQIFILQKKV